MTINEQGSCVSSQRLPIVGKKLFAIDRHREDCIYPNEMADRLTWKKGMVGLSRKLFWEVPDSLDFTLPELASDELDAT